MSSATKKWFRLGKDKQSPAAPSSTSNLDGLHAEGIALLNSAIAAEDSYQYDEALKLYARGCDVLITFLKTVSNEGTRARVSHLVNVHLKRAEQLSAKRKGLSVNTASSSSSSTSDGAGASSPVAPIARRSPTQPSSSASASRMQTPALPASQPTTPPTAAAASKPSLSASGLDPALFQSLATTIVADTGVSFTAIVGLDDAKQRLYEACILPQLRPELFTGIRKPHRGILLYGPPGTGKTLLAKAVCSEAKSTFFNISAASLNSSSYGVGEKLVRALFLLAANRAPSIIFIDEIDSIMGRRSGDEHEASRRLKTELMIQMDGLASPVHTNANVTVIAATNIPESLDEAIIRRLPVRIFLPPPSQQQRLELLKSHLSGIHHCVSDRQLTSLAGMSDGYSASDLTALSSEAAMLPLRSLSSSALLNTPSESIPPVSYQHYVNAMHTIRPSVTAQRMAEYEAFHRQQQHGG